jgi:peroxiredoxin
MKIRSLDQQVGWLLLLTLVVAPNLYTDEPNSQPLAIGAKMPSFELTDFRGREWKSSEFSDKPILAVVFFGTECPLVRLYGSRLSDIQAKFADEGVQLIGIDSNRHDSMKEIANFAKLTKVEFPLVKDPGNVIADAFGAQRTPEIFIFDKERTLQYRGQIDDQYTYGRQRPEVEREYVVDAISQIAAGKPAKPQTTEPIGCHIGRVFHEVKSNEINYSKHISRILQNRCVSCHRNGEIAPFSLTDYDEVVGWAEMMREVVNENRMPPWHANPEHGEFANDSSLTAEEKQMINTWVENGAPKGNPDDLPEPLKFTEGWQIGEPDVVFAMSKRPYKVPATGTIDYEYFVVETGFKEDKYISAAEIRIGNRSVVHHVIVAQGDDVQRPHGAPDSEWITACAPGSPPLQLPDGYAKVIPAGAKLIFQMHYTPNGTAAEDISRVGFKFVDKSKVKQIVATVEILNQRLKIPAGAENHEVKAIKRMPADILLLTLFPHMHLRGKAFRYIAKYPDGKSEILLDVPQYDFNWQNGYQLKTPKRLPKGTIVECIAHFDNSTKNIANPDPTKTVRWGDQTWEEMMIGYFDGTLADQDLTKER